MKLLFIMIAALAGLGLALGIAALIVSPVHAIALLIPSSIYISAFMLSYIIEEKKII
ncbi:MULTISPECIES: hypothetical protein [unclassified Lentimonas]|uniref:hypothetical protein n=1 Tax=unclassified Lentimonas TaxID=2630993 RepID=UPI0013222303|nr:MULTISPECIES: hypothetical protein [unclassified Lentimonas]CAA6691478.1 Unannotated [Lentimonas sp. CC10]CAA6693804.1 Unannotated [Lentimonas sp. CC19]CAA7070938.1 Unannotated [Lentimonas sp. CC11]